MLEECIDINKAKNNDYIIHPNFSPELKEINDQINDQKRRMEKLRHAVEDDLSVKSVNITESALHTYVFEC
jgi:DNA mismatch repair ATPase MutS